MEALLNGIQDRVATQLNREEGLEYVITLNPDL